MRTRALLSILLVAVWLTPVLGAACPPDEAGGEGHAHAHEGQASGEENARSGHGHGEHAAPGHQDAGPSPATESAPASSPNEPVCCAQSSQAPMAQLAPSHAKPRPELSLPIVQTPSLPFVLARPATGAEFRRRQPPPLPYARSRRPLLI